MTFDMSALSDPLLKDLERRGLIAQTTAEADLSAHLAGGSRTVYCGFDPTADSLHIGSLVPLLALQRFQRAGHRPVALVGGATGLIGDPSFKAQERSLNAREVVEGWVDSIAAQLARFVDFDCGDHSAVVVNNVDWIGGMDVLAFLRDIGKHFSVSQMVHKESVRQRIEREGEGISFTEFTYMILQSLDFAELNRRYDCTVQIGGSDQWGNITGGIDLTRRLNAAQVFGLTLPLVTKADGTKFGKTEAGTIWLDPERTSPYAFYQFWVNTADADVYRYLRYFTFLEPDEIDAIERADAERAGRPEAQGALADEVTRLVHGREGVEAARRISEALFGGEPEKLGREDVLQLRLDGLPATDLVPAQLAGVPLTGLLVDCGLAAAGKQVKDALGRQGVSINGQPLSMDDNMRAGELFVAEKALFGRFFIVKLGKKKYHLFELKGSS